MLPAGRISGIRPDAQHEEREAARNGERRCGRRDHESRRGGDCERRDGADQPERAVSVSIKRGDERCDT